MQIKVWCDSGANIHSCHSRVVDVEQLCFDAEEWDEMDDQEKAEAVQEYWASLGYPEIGFEEQ